MMMSFGLRIGVLVVVMIVVLVGAALAHRGVVVLKNCVKSSKLDSNNFGRETNRWTSYMPNVIREGCVTFGCVVVVLLGTERRKASVTSYPSVSQ